jgi:hypothetical protein
VSPVYFGHNTIWLRFPDQKVDTNAVIRAISGRGIAKDEFSGALLYKLQRKKRLDSNYQSNVDSTFAEDTSTSLQLLIMWGSNTKLKVSLCALLIKHNNAITWNENTLEKLYSMHLDLLRGTRTIINRWSLNDVIMLRTILRSRQKDGRDIIEITISEGTRGDDSIEPEPLWVPSGI